MPAIILENIRSAYNVWNMIRTADCFWFDVIISWYTPSPFKDEKVAKTALWAEKSVSIVEFWNPRKATDYAQKYWLIIASEITHNSVWLSEFLKQTKFDDIAIVFWNEIDGVLSETLWVVDKVVYIPMIGMKESLNVWQSSAIFMYEIYNNLL